MTCGSKRRPSQDHPACLVKTWQLRSVTEGPLVGLSRSSRERREEVTWFTFCRHSSLFIPAKQLIVHRPLPLDGADVLEGAHVSVSSVPFRWTSTALTVGQPASGLQHAGPCHCNRALTHLIPRSEPNPNRGISVTVMSSASRSLPSARQ